MRTTAVHGPTDLRRLLVVVVTLGVTLAAAGCSSSSASTPEAATHPTGMSFLTGYVDTDGRVVRRNQGGDTVSEGQAYAMLLDVAVGNQAQFDAVWKWSEANLMQPDGLLASHWVNGAVVDPNSASDADVDVARALILAGADWHEPTFTRQGKVYATAILTNETVAVDHTVWLVAGPWARTSPYYIDPSYFDPAAFELLASATRDARWTEVLDSSDAALVGDTDDGTRLPSDWAQLNASGHVQASTPPAGGGIVFGYDAFRTLVRQADDCRDGTGWRIDRSLQTLVDRTASPHDRADTYTTDGSPAEPGDNPLMEIAAAGAAHAAGDTKAMTGYLMEADAAAARQPSYFLDAWVELAGYLLTASPISVCQA